MDTSKEADQIAYEFLPHLRVYKDGRVERLTGTDTVPPCTDPLTSVTSKDIAIAGEPTDITARLYLPKLDGPARKLPLLVYFPGGGFCVSTPFTGQNHAFVQTVVAKAGVVAISVNYGKAPENPIPAAYEDSWNALHWAFSHCNGGGPEAWLNQHVDFEKVFIAGESAGANIAHNLAIAAGNPEFGTAIRLVGIALVHPYFWGSAPIGSESLNPDFKASMDRLWPFICPSNPDNDDPRLNPVVDGPLSLAGLGCGRVLVCLAEKDPLRDRGWMYYEALGQSGWLGVAEVMETDGEDHGFHLKNLENERAKDLIQRLADFLDRDIPSWFS